MKTSNQTGRPAELAIVETERDGNWYEFAVNGHGGLIRVVARMEGDDHDYPLGKQVRDFLLAATAIEQLTSAPAAGRDAFEQYAHQMGKRDFEQNEFGDYRNPFTQEPWNFWRASRAAMAAGAPAAQYRCTRCDATIAAGVKLTCERGPCPMALMEQSAEAPDGLEPPRHIIDAAMEVARYEYGHGVTRSSIVAIWKALGSPWYMPVAALPAPVLDALRFYANGHHFNIDSEHQQFDTVSGEPANWLFSERDDDCTMIEDGSVARAALCGAPLGFEEPETPVEGEVFRVDTQVAAHERAEPVGRQPYQWRDTGALETGDA